LYNSLFQNGQNLCSKFALSTRTAFKMTTPMADSGINDRLVKLRPLCFDENADENLSAVVYCQCSVEYSSVEY